jgi:hypothetical protein
LKLLISWSALQMSGLPKGLNYLGILVGVVGIISIGPGLHDLVGLFGMSQILWFIWLGIVLLRRSPVSSRSVRLASTRLLFAA